MDADKTDDNVQIGPGKAVYSATQKPETQGNQVVSANKMQKVDKIRLWAGICFIAFILIVVLGLLVIPRIIEPCCIFSSIATSHYVIADGADIIFGFLLHSF